MSNTTAQPLIEIDKAVKALIQQQTESCTIVHCRHYEEYPSGVRIWPSTFLIEDNGGKCKLIKAFNISMMPWWTYHLVFNDFIRFTLVFEGLSKHCKVFKLLEDIPQPFGFYSKDISRNSSGVYHTEIFC